MKVLQIDTALNAGPTGRYASGIGDFMINRGHESYIGYGRARKECSSHEIKIGSKIGIWWHILVTRLFDRHGFGSKIATKVFINRVEKIDPDIIHLHNIHGYYIHIGVLFEYLERAKKPVVWTLHDCWSFTGHCSYFDRFDCEKWKTCCNRCPAKKSYPASWWIDNSKNNYKKKKELFTSVEKLVIVSPSNWLAKHVENSFLNQSPVRVINVGIDLEKFRPVSPEIARRKFNLSRKHIILGVASVWSRRKGMDDFIKLRSLLNSDIEIVLVGLNTEQIRNLPKGMQGVSRTDSVDDLISLYSLAEVFVNPTYMDNFPATNLEALACGTPVITYNSGGSPEAISDECGLIVPKGDINGLYNAIQVVIKNGKNYYFENCRLRAVNMFNRDDRTREYFDLYDSLI